MRTKRDEAKRRLVLFVYRLYIGHINYRYDYANPIEDDVVEAFREYHHNPVFKAVFETLETSFRDLYAACDMDDQRTPSGEEER